MGQAAAVSTKPAPATGKPDQSVLGWVLHNVVWIWLIALVLIFGLFNEFFFTTFNLQNIMVQATVLGVIGLAVALPLLVAEIDLSLPANLGFSSAIGPLDSANPAFHASQIAPLRQEAVGDVARGR